MSRRALKIDPKSVFLNVPFDKKYEQIFIGIVVGLVTLGLKPRSVIEIPEQGQGRMDRLFNLIRTCGASIHDLSRVGSPARFNMPFELGLAFSLKQMTGQHFFALFETKKYRLDRTLSDLKMIDPKIHGGNGQRALQCVYESFKPYGHPAPTEQGQKIYRYLVRDIKGLRQRRETIFNPIAFEALITRALLLKLHVHKLA